MNIRLALEASAEKTPEKVYLYWEDKQITYREFDSRINSIANCLLDLGVCAGDKVCIMLPNCPEFLLVWFALNKVGAVMVPINTKFKVDEVEYIINHVGAKLLFSSSEFNRLLDIVEKDCDLLEKIVFAEERGAAANRLSLYEMYDNSTRLRSIGIGETDDAVYVYTSGTTGTPKGVMLPHRTYILAGKHFAATVGATRHEGIMTPNPLFHVNAQVYSAMASMLTGCSFILLPKFSASRIWDQARQYKATIVIITSATIPMILAQPGKLSDCEHSVRVVTSGYGGERLEEFEQRFDVRLLSGYSMTEAIMGVFDSVSSVRKPMTNGRVQPHPEPGILNQVKIVDDQGKERRRGEVGEIIINNPAMMKGYFREPEKTAETIKEGWIHTGDLGWMDEHDYVAFVGRKKDLIRKKGENISPVEVEQVINNHPSVAECAVVGLPSGLGPGDEELVAFVVLKEREKTKEVDLIKWCSGLLADFKVPRYVEIRQSLPKTSIGKIMKGELKKYTLDYFNQRKEGSQDV
jgi:carnitine-CoA ligase